MRNNPCKTELKVARSQRNRLRTIEKKLTEMSSEWDGLSICRHWKNNFPFIMPSCMACIPLIYSLPASVIAAGWSGAV